jgi:SAM-dependent methyltransferase
MSEPRLHSGIKSSRETPWWGIHVARYKLANRSLTPDIRVLDLACGTGYGLDILSLQRRCPIGIDIDDSALLEVRTGNRLIRGDGCNLPLKSAALDAITSFETIEHVIDARAFLSEIRRTLRPGGFLILSTPNANYTRPINGVPANRYHHHEYYPSELTSLLAEYFGEVNLFGQIISSRFVISPFLEDQQRLPRTVRNVSRVNLWRLLNKLPGSVRNRASRAIWGHELYPSETDYEFTSNAAELAPVLVVHARKAS